MTKDEALKQWGDELRQDGLYVSSVIKAAFSDGWTMALASLPAVPSDEALYTMDQMRDYALAFHKSRLDAAGDKASSQGVFSPFNACMYRDECRARAERALQDAQSGEEKR